MINRVLSAVLVASTTLLPSTDGRQRERALPHAEHLSLDFSELPGVRELTSRLILRPKQRQALLAQGLTEEQAQARRTDARRELERHDIKRRVPATDETIIVVPEGVTELALAEALLDTGLFEYVEPDWLLSPLEPASPQQGVGLSRQSATPQRTAVSLCPNDPLFPLQWHHQADRMRSCEAWSRLTGDPSISIGICDTGLRTTHEDLQLNRLEGYNAVDQLWESQGGNIQPVHPHGTRTTGTAMANGDNNLGVSGVGWNLSHRMIRVSNTTDGRAFLSDIQHGARTSIENGDRIASVSYHGAASASNPATAAYIRTLGGILIWGAGNTSSNYTSPNRDSDVLIVVGATDSTDNLWSFSSFGNFVDLVAPGVGIYTTDAISDSAYRAGSGTSYSCPLTAGMCAMIWSAQPNLSPADVEYILKQSADDLGAVGLDEVFGYGRIDLASALEFDATRVPVAALSGLPTSGRSPLSVNFRDQSTGVPTSWSWNFGDGTISTAQNPTHTFMTSGRYTVALTVTNALGTDTRTEIDYLLVDVIPPVAALDGSPTTGISPLAVSFVDLSTGGLPTSWSWDFGDGATSNLQDPTHIYTTSGSFTVSLVAANPYGSSTATRASLITVDFIPPSASFTGVPTSGASPLVVNFTDASTAGVATAWSWSFGDGSTSTEQHPTHTYTVAGAYSVTLDASNAYGTDRLTRFSYIQVLPGPPIVANLTGTPTVGPAPLSVVFTDLSIGNVIGWEWDFGDGGKSTVQHPIHVYTSPGQYNVSLQVTNPSGKDDQLELMDYVDVQ